MKKDHLSIRKIVKNLKINQGLKLCARVPIAASSCLDGTHRGHPFSTYAKFSEKLTFRTPLYPHVRVRIRG